MNTYNYLCLFGVQALVTSVIASVVSAVISKHKTLKQKHNQEKDDNKVLREGVQALLRDKLYDKYNKAVAKGSVSIYEKDNFMNIWNNYHALGANGVMDEIKEDYMNIPLE